MTNPQQLRDILSHFSVSNQEAELYLAALALEKPNVSKIAQVVGRQRTAIYFHLNNLIAKGLVKRSRVGRVFFFTPLAPGELARQVEQWTTELKSLVPHLESLKAIQKEYPVIEITESKKGYYAIYDAISCLPTGTIFRVMEGRDALANELTLLTPEQWKTFFQRIIERKIETKAIFTEESLTIPSKKLSEENLALVSQRIWHLRSIPEETLPFPNLLFIYGSTIAFLFPVTRLVMTIRHPGIADSLTTMFDALFMVGKPITSRWNQL